MKLEFFDFNGELWYRNETECEQLTERSEAIVEMMFSKIHDLYPDAYEVLDKIYKSFNCDMRLKRFKIVSRFCRCNFGIINKAIDVDENGRFVFEFVPCPLRGECQHDGIICNPKFNSNISPAEKRVLELLFQGKNEAEISERLFISPHTTHNHIRNAFVRLGVHSKAEFIDYAHRNKMFDYDGF